MPAATRAAHQIAAFAKDQPIERAKQAIECLELAGRALDEVVSHFPAEVQDREDVRQELAFNHAAMEDSIAFVEARRRRVGEAAAAVLRADEHASILTGEDRDRRAGIGHRAAFIDQRYRALASHRVTCNTG